MAAYARVGVSLGNKETRPIAKVILEKMQGMVLAVVITKQQGPATGRPEAKKSRIVPPNSLIQACYSCQFLLERRHF